MVETTHLQYKSVSKVGRADVFKNNILTDNIFGHRLSGNTAVYLLQPKFLVETIFARIADTSSYQIYNDK